PRPPSLAGMADEIARLLQQIRINREPRRQKAVEIGALLKPMRRLAGQHRRTGSGTGWRCRKCVREQETLPRDPVEHRGFDDAIAVRSRMRPGPVVCQAKENIWTSELWRRGRVGGHQAR